MASIMDHTRAVRREDLAREAEDQADGSRVHRRDDGAEDEEALAARAALDAYMQKTLGLQFDVPPPRPAPSKPAASVADKSKKKKNAYDDENKDGDEPMGSLDDDNDDDDDDDDDDARDIKSKRKDAKEQKSGGATEFAFRLFSGSGRTAATTQDSNDTSAPRSSIDATAAPAPAPAPIVLLDDGDGSELLGPGGLLNPPRPLSFYLAGEPTPEALERYSQITVSGEDIVKASRETRTWGWEVPWRARTNLKASSKSALRALLANALTPDAAAALPENLAVALASATNALPAWAASSQSPETTNPLPLLHKPDDTATATATTKHCRPGKRRRVILRKREQERREKAAKAAAQAQSKEEHLSEKKKRLNRIKKLRRREKKRAQKGGGDGGDDSGDDSGGD